MIYLDCSSGMAGDMFVGALIWLGADFRALRRRLAPVARLSCCRVRRGNVEAVKFSVKFSPAPRKYTELVAVVCGLGLAPKPRRLALRILRILAEAESKVHGVPVGKVHLHEAADCVVDAAAAALALEELGFLGEVFMSSVVSCGRNAPATQMILQEYGIPVKFVCDRELVTPTGAAILAALVSDWGPMSYCGAGAGAGSMRLPWPNVVRVAQASPKAILESNIDDCTPEHVSHLASSLMESGALDVHVLPCMMKKGRIGFLVRVLTERPKEHAAAIMAETGCLGVRVLPVDVRYELPRRVEPVRLRIGGALESVRVKFSPAGYKPEFDDVASAARRHGLPFWKVREMVSWAVLKSRR
jgi:pyridinium-3,5-bisthiocarboxylic acid mononucleotide nickel chelatase